MQSKKQLAAGSKPAQRGPFSVRDLFKELQLEFAHPDRPDVER